MKYLLAVALALSLLSTAVVAQKSGGTVTGPVITTSLLKNFNPFTQLPNSNPARGFMYEPLLFHNSQSNATEYRLATAYVYSDDLKSVTFTLREGAKWSDGKPVTAADLIFSHELAQSNLKMDVFALWQGENPRLSGMEQLDDRRVRFDLTSPDSSLYLTIAAHYVVPKHIWSSIDDPITFTNETPVGSGPLTEVKNFKPQQVIICRNPHYWEGEKPYVDCLKLRQYQSNDQVQAALLRNELDWGSNFIADIEKTYVARNPENNHFWYPAGPSVNIYLNTNKTPFDNLKFRQAFSMSLNRAEIVDFATYGYASLNPHATGIGDYFKSWYDAAVNQKHDYLNQYDPDTARKLLDEAGYKDLDDDGFRENRDGSELNFDIMVVNGWSDWVQSVQMVVDYLKEVGVRARTRTVDFGQYVEAFKSGDFDSGILWGDVGANPIAFYRTSLHSAGKGINLQANHGIYDPGIDAIIDEFNQTADSNRHREIIGELQEFVASNLMMISLFSNPEWYQYSTKRFEGWPTADNAFINPRFYADGPRVMLINNLYLK